MGYPKRIAPVVAYRKPQRARSGRLSTWLQRAWAAIVTRLLWPWG